MEPTKIGHLSFSSSDRWLSEGEGFGRWFAQRVPLIVQDVFKEPHSHFSLAVFEGVQDVEAELAKHFGTLLLLRFRLLTKEISSDYNCSQYLFLGFRDDNYEAGSVYANGYINGLEPVDTFAQSVEKLSDAAVSPTHIEPTDQVLRWVAALSNQMCTEQQKIVHGIHRFILAHAPDRHTDTFTRILNLVSGIEGFLKLERAEGREQFGSKLDERFGLTELKAWGSQVYDLRSRLVHRQLDELPEVGDQDTYRHLLYFNNPDEATRHAPHFIVAREVLRQLVMNALTKTSFDSECIRALLYSNETPIREACKLIEQRTPFGQPYFDFLESIKQNALGGELCRKKQLVRFLIRQAHEMYPCATEFDLDRRVFRDPKSCLSAMEAARSKLDSIYFSTPVSPEDIEKLRRVRIIGRTLWNLLIPLTADIRNENRTRD